MPARTVSLTPEQDAFIGELLDQGEYRTANDAIGDAIGALRQRRALDARKRDQLHLSIQAGVAALDGGAYTDVEDADLDAYLDTLATPPTP